MSHSDDIDYFDDIIEEDYGESDSDNQNSDPQTERPSRKYKERMAPRTEKQLEMLKLNAPAKALARKEKAVEWLRLSEQLNQIGPPVHDWITWRTVLRSYKAKERKGCSSKTEFEEVNPGKTDNPPIMEIELENSDNDIVFLLSRLVEKMDKLVECLQSLTEGVQKISKVLEAKFENDSI